MIASADDDFPPAPWHLRGDAIMAWRLVPESAVRQLVPADVRIVCPWPGRTVAILYWARYSESPVGDYCEFILAPALTRSKGKAAFWISHIVVDNHVSLLAGRSIWSLPKTSGAFRWDRAAGIDVQLDSLDLTARLSTKASRSHLRLPFAGPATSRYASLSKRFFAQGSAALSIATGSVELDVKDLELAQLGFNRPQTLCVLSNMKLTIGQPRQLGVP